LYQPLKQPFDRYSRRHLCSADGFDTCDDMGELLLEKELEFLSAMIIGFKY